MSSTLSPRISTLPSRYCTQPTCHVVSETRTKRKPQGQPVYYILVKELTFRCKSRNINSILLFISLNRSLSMLLGENSGVFIFGLEGGALAAQRSMGISLRKMFCPKLVIFTIGSFITTQLKHPGYCIKGQTPF